MELELTKLSSPRIFLVRMMVFLILCGLIVTVLYKQIFTAFLANPGLNALIFAVLAFCIGLLVRKPFIGTNHFVSEKLEETELM